MFECRRTTTARPPSRCNGCGRTDLETQAFRCVWPDERITIQRHCHICRLIWHRQLRALGASLEEIDDSEATASANEAAHASTKTSR